MWEKVTFYFWHSWNDLKVNRVRTAFALLCIAAGVAAIVSLQTLAVMINDSLVGNLQESNRGDIQFQISSDLFSSDDSLQQAHDAGFLTIATTSMFGQDMNEYRVSSEGLDQLQTWLDEQYPGQVEVTYRQPVTGMIGVFFGGGNGTAATNTESGEQVNQLYPIIVDVATYPYYGEVRTLDGALLADVLQEPTDVVFDRDTAAALDIAVGDVVRLNGVAEELTVQGLVAKEMEIKNPASDMLTALFGFYYLDHAAVALFEDVELQAEQVYLQLDESLDVLAVTADLETQYPFIMATTTEDLREQYEQLAAGIDQLVSVMGLLSLLIGCIGIVITMQVIVRRRTLEIAVLKTVGLQANEVTALFMMEALLMGIVGSVVGILLGWGAVFAIRWSAEQLLATNLTFIPAVGPAVNGLVVGTLVTLIFGFLPTLTAGQVRPSMVLRPHDNILPRAGILRTLAALIVIIVTLSLVAQTIIGNYRNAFLVTVGAFIAAGLLYVALSVVIWLVGRLLPSFGVAELKISLRQMLAGRRRAAITLLALVIGVFSLSLITLMAQSITNMLNYGLNEAVGGNVLITIPSRMMLGRVQTTLDELDGVESYTIQEGYTLDFISLEEGDTGEVLAGDDLRERLEVLNDNMFGPPGGEGMGDDFELDWLDILGQEIGSIGVRELDQLSVEQQFVDGRQLMADDVGLPVLVIGKSDTTEAAGVSAGDRLTYAFRSGGGLLGGLTGGSDDEPEQITFEVVGVTASSGMEMDMGGGVGGTTYVLPGAFPEDRQPDTVAIVADVTEEALPELRRQLAGVPGVFALETAVLNDFLNSLMDTFIAFPTMVAALGLIVGGVVIANSVALTTMERRKEIAIMKAVGLQRERVLGMLLLEYAVLGLIGGLIGVGIGLVGLIIMLAASGTPVATLPLGTAFLLMGLCVAVALAAALTSAWGASGEKPLNVLRYE